MTGEPETFHCGRPPAEHAKVIRSLCRSDLLEADVQLIDDGGANRLHHHTGQNGFFMVLSGGARFYGADDEVVAELGERDGVLVPHGFDYWFEKTGDGPAEVLHVAAISDAMDDERVGESSGSLMVE